MTALFPIGTMAVDSNSGTIDGVSYTVFEPNQKCNSTPMYSNYVTRFQQQTILTRKKALPTLSIQYNYDNIFSSEYSQLAHFIDSTEDNLTPFYVIDFSKGVSPTSISSDFDITLPNTRLFSSIANQKAHYVFFWDGINWKFGEILTVNLNTSLVVDVTAGNASSKNGGMTSTQVQLSNVFIYPIYECYSSGGSLDEFQTNQYVNDSVERGFMYTGSLSFVSKYKI